MIDGTVEIPARVMVAFGVAGTAGLAFMTIGIIEAARGHFARPKPAPENPLTRELVGMWDRNAYEGVQPDTLRLARQTAALARMELEGAKPEALLHELSRIEDTLGALGARLFAQTPEGAEHEAVIARRVTPLAATAVEARDDAAQSEEMAAALA